MHSFVIYQHIVFQYRGSEGSQDIKKGWNTVPPLLPQFDFSWCGEHHNPTTPGRRGLISVHWLHSVIQGSQSRGTQQKSKAANDAGRREVCYFLACALWLQLNQNSTTRTACSVVAQPRCTGVTPIGLDSPIPVTIHESTPIDMVTANHIQIESPSHIACRCDVRAETIRRAALQSFSLTQILWC